MRAILYNPWNLLTRVTPQDAVQNEYQRSISRMFEDEVARRGLDVSKRRSVENDEHSVILCGVRAKAPPALHKACFSEVTLPDGDTSAWSKAAKAVLFGDLADSRYFEVVYSLTDFKEKRGNVHAALVDEEGMVRMEPLFLTKWEGYPEPIAGPVLFTAVHTRSGRFAETQISLDTCLAALEGILLTANADIVLTVPKSQMH